MNGTPATDRINELWPKNELGVEELLIVERGVRYCHPQAIHDGLAAYRLDHSFRTPTKLSELIDAVRAVDRRLRASGGERVPEAHRDPCEAARGILRRLTTWEDATDGAGDGFKMAVKAELERVNGLTRERVIGLSEDERSAIRAEVLESDSVPHDVRHGIPDTSRRGTLRPLCERELVKPDGTVDSLWRAVLAGYWFRRGVVQ